MLSRELKKSIINIINTLQYSNDNKITNTSQKIKLSLYQSNYAEIYADYIDTSKNMASCVICTMYNNYTTSNINNFDFIKNSELLDIELSKLIKSKLQGNTLEYNQSIYLN